MVVDFAIVCSALPRDIVVSSTKAHRVLKELEDTDILPELLSVEIRETGELPFYEDYLTKRVTLV